MSLSGRKLLLLAIGALSAVLVGLDANDAEAGRHHRRRNRRLSRVAVSPAPVRSSAPATESDGSPLAPGTRPVAGDALEGDYRKDVVDTGVVLTMGPGRALVLSSFRGLVVVDTTDPTTPRILSHAAVEGRGQRMFMGTDQVVVLSATYDGEGAHTLATSFAIRDDALTSAGTLSLEGSLHDAARTGDDLLVVTGAGGYWPGPLLMAGGVADGTSGASGAPGVDANGYRKRAKAPKGPSALDRPGRRHAGPARVAPSPKKGDANSILPPWWFGSDTTHVARLSVGVDGALTLLGTLDVDGSTLADAIDGTSALLAVQKSWWPTLDVSSGPDAALWLPPETSLVHVDSDAAGAPHNAGSLALKDSYGVAQVDRAGTTARVLEYTGSGETLAVFELSGGAPEALGSFALDTWATATAFTGDAFVFATTEWNWSGELPGDPALVKPEDLGMMDGQRTDGSADPTTGSGGDPAPGPIGGPVSTLHVVDLRDPAAPTAAEVALPQGWVGGLVTVSGDVVGAIYGTDAAGSTTVFRADLSDLAHPSISGQATFEGYANLGQLLGDLLLLNGGTYRDDGGYAPSLRLVDVADGGLTLGGSIATGAWAAQAARDGDLLGMASFDRLTLVDVADVTNPVVTGEVRLVVNVSGFAPLDADHGAALTTDYFGGRIEIRSVSLPQADALAPLDVLDIGTGDAQMFADAPFLYVLATDWATGRASLHVVDASDPAALRERGTLDLASYPGRVFRKGKALLLLREVWSLFAEDGSGATTSAKDAFGPCRRTWLTDDLSAVLDVVDLRDPDHPVADTRLHLRWDYAGLALLSGDLLYVSSYVDVTQEGDEWPSYAYAVKEIDVSDPFKPTAGPAIYVPGTLVAATQTAHRVITAEYVYDPADGTSKNALDLVDLSLPFDDRVVATQALDGWPETVTTGSGHAYVVTESWGPIVSLAGKLGADGTVIGPILPNAQLLTLALGDFSDSDRQDRDRGAYGGEIELGRLFLRTWGWNGALDVYSLEDPAVPVFLFSKDVEGLAGDVSVVGDRAYIPAGLYGVASFDLTR